MDRITGATVDIGSGRRGFRDRNLPLSQAGTVPGATWFNGAQEEIVRAIEILGLTPSDANREQLIQAMRRLAGGNVRTISAGGVTLTADDAGLVLVNASGSFGITLPAANSAGGVPQRITLARTDSTANTITVQRAGSDTIEGATSINLLPGRRLTLQSDGSSGWSAVGGSGNLIAVRTITSTGTYTPTPGARSAIVELVGGGGAGGGIAATGAGFAGGGGGGGAGSYGLLYIASGLASVTVTIGAGGAGASAAVGGSGGTSSFGALMSCPGGTGGAAGGAFNTGAVSASAGGSGGAAVGATLGTPGATGAACLTLAAASAIGGGGAAGRFGSGGQPNGANGSAAVPGAAATGFGAGGGGAVGVSSGSATAGGAGSPGVCLIWEFG